MSEVMISRRGGGGSGWSSETKLVTEYITFNRNWIVPNGVKDNQFSVRIFGAGCTNGYGSGWMANEVYTNLQTGQAINIIIGKINPDYNNIITSQSTGGTSSFGTYIYANGGDGLHGGAGGGDSRSYGGIGYQFGGGAGGRSGGSGGPWGGGGGAYGYQVSGNGGHGGTYGGGGGGSFYGGWGGNGGTYGGGGGAGFEVLSSSQWRGYGGRGGTYGGNGGYVHTSTTTFPSTDLYVVPTNGTNTITWTNVAKDDITGEYLRGNGVALSSLSSYFSANNLSGGGGGYGGCGGLGAVSYTNYRWASQGGGGGGGYGSNGGNATYSGSELWSGGGGGYGGDGGKGGGGYGKVSKGSSTGGGGGGYYCPAVYTYGAGVGIWENGILVARFADGGAFTWYQANTRCYPKQGICIIQYYT